MSTDSDILNEYAALLFQSMYFPTLFPYGVGDKTKINFRYNVSFTESYRNVLKYVVADC